MNHLAFSVHRFKHQFSDIKFIKQFLEEKEFKLNTDGGVIKGLFYSYYSHGNGFIINHYLIRMKKYISVSLDGLLLQVSSISDKLAVEFSDGVTETIPASYIEFTQRLVLPQFKDVPFDEVMERNLLRK